MVPRSLRWEEEGTRRKRNHQGLENRIIVPELGTGSGGESELSGAAWWIASLLLPGCRMKPTIRVSGHYGVVMFGFA